MPWLMIVLSSATTGRPSASASRTSSVIVSIGDLSRRRGFEGGHRLGPAGAGGVRAPDGRGGGPVALAGRLDRVGATEPGRDPGGQHRVAGPGDVDDLDRDRGQVDGSRAPRADVRPAS